jgi:insertion element IS1 protein InsB
LLERLKPWSVKLYCTDDYAPYDKLLPGGRHYIGKDETVAIERVNSRLRHWFARFRRRTCVVSKALEMVDATIALFAAYHVNRTATKLTFLIPSLCSGSSGSGGDGRHCICAAWPGGAVRKGLAFYPTSSPRATAASVHQTSLLRRQQIPRVSAKGLLQRLVVKGVQNMAQGIERRRTLQGAAKQGVQHDPALVQERDDEMDPTGETIGVAG